MRTSCLFVLLLGAAALAQNLPVTCADLTEAVPAPRWFCAPLSRLVVNPTWSYAQGKPVVADGRTLSTDLAYYCGPEPQRLPAFLTWQLGPREGAVLGEALQLEAGQWRRSGVTAAFAGGTAQVASTGAYGSLERLVTVDLDRTPRLLVDVPACAGTWALKLNDGQAFDTTLVADTATTGTQSLDVAAIAGWHGTKTFVVRFWAIGGPAKPVTLARLQFCGVPAAPPGGGRHDTWAPHVATARATCGATELEASTVFFDESTLVQRAVCRRVGGELWLTGQFGAGTVEWDAPRQALLLHGRGYHAAIAFSRPARFLGVRSAELAWLMPETSPSPPNGVWAVAFDDVHADDEVLAAVRFTPSEQGTAVTAAVARACAAPAGWPDLLRAQEQRWNRRLAGVPHPLDVTPRAIDPLGVTAEAVRRTYYRAWVFLLANTLPPMAENGFAYPQDCCGKPSLWAEGAPQALPSAQWESFMAMQALASVDPQTTWAAYEGQMTQIGPDGSIKGEGLPACHAQTAWCLYQATGERERLAKVYPGVKALLDWKLRDPRWIYHNSRPPGSKDNEFVVHALLDAGYAARIAQELGRDEEVRHWQAQRAELGAHFHEWFWQPPAGPMYRLFETADGSRAGADSAWNLKALALPPDLLTAAERDWLLAAFAARRRDRMAFLVPGISKYPNFEYTLKGLLQYGKVAEALAMADAGMRDVTRAGEFTEEYGDIAAPVPGGVRPSVFGTRHAIDDVLQHNGVVLDEGLPVIWGLPPDGAPKGCSNLHVRGEALRVVVDAGRLTLAGPALNRLRLPPGFQAAAAGAPEWQGPLAPGQVLRLEAR